MNDTTAIEQASVLLYSNCLLLEPEDGFDKVVSELASWVEWKTKVLITPETLLAGLKKYTFPDRSELESYAKRDGDQVTSLRVIYSHEDYKLPGRRWITEVLTRQAGGHEVECEVNLRVTDSEPMDKGPMSSRPRLIVNLMESCRPVGATPGLYTKPLSLATAEKFIADIENPLRKAPLVVVSSNRSCDQPINPERLREQLVGLANVYCITEDTDTWELTEVLGDAYSVYGEAIRVFWPIAPGLKQAGSHLFLPRGKNQAPRTAFQMETAVFLNVLRRHMQGVKRSNLEVEM